MPSSALEPAGRNRPERSSFPAFVYGLCPLTLASFAIEGHLDSLMLALLAGVGICARTRRHWTGAVLLVGAILAKLVPLIVLPWLAVRHWRGAVVWVGVVLLGVKGDVGAGGWVLVRVGGLGGGTGQLGLGNGVLSALLGSVAAVERGQSATWLGWAASR